MKGERVKLKIVITQHGLRWPVGHVGVVKDIVLGVYSVRMRIPGESRDWADVQLLAEEIEAG